MQVGADGASSMVRTLLEEQGIGKVRSVHLEEKRENTRVYKTIMIPLQDTEYSGPDGSGICTLSERSAAGRVLESLPTKEGVICNTHHVCTPLIALLSVKLSDDQLCHWTSSDAHMSCCTSTYYRYMLRGCFQ